MRRTAVRIFLLGVALLPNAASAAWLKPAGEGFFSTNFAYYSSHEFVSPSGDKSHQPAFQKYELNPYLEYGWDADTTIGASAFLHRLISSNGQGGSATNQGVGDPSFFLRRALWKSDNAILSLQPLIKLPSLYSDGGTPRSGTDDMDTELRLQAGYGFDWLGQHHYTTLEPAYRRRFGQWEDQWKLDATLGLRLNDALTLLPQLFLTRSTESLNSDSGRSGVVNDYHLLKSQISLLYEFEPGKALQAGYFHDLYARNTGLGDGFLFGLQQSF